MKTWKKLIIYAVAALVMQLGVLLYLNNDFLASYSAFNSSEPSKNVQESNKILMPESIDKAQASADGHYVSYYKEGVLYVIDSKTGVRKKIEMETGQTLTALKWHVKNNKIIMGEQSIVNKATRVSLTVYDAESGHQEVLRDLSWLGSNFKIGDIEFAGDSDIIVKTIQSGGKMELQYIGKDVTKIAAAVHNISFYKYLGKDKNIVYQDGISKKYYITGSNKPIENRGEAFKILNVDFNGNAYAVENIKLDCKALLYKNLTNKNENYQSLTLPEPESKDNIYVLNDGTIYVNNLLEGKLTDVKSNRVLKYQGKFLAAFNGGLYSISDDVLQKFTFEEE